MNNIFLTRTWIIMMNDDNDISDIDDDEDQITDEHEKLSIYMW